MTFLATVLCYLHPVFANVFVCTCILLLVVLQHDNIKATVLQILLENHELCKYAKISLHIHTIVDLNQNIALNLLVHMFTVLLRKQTMDSSTVS